jgi:2-polyprenyl-3-methyl-5-hydroxy-6-metoxy-1,4-benzoquinol methylase
MIAEQLERLGSKFVSGYPPEGREYWAARFWDRDAAEVDVIIGAHYQAQKKVIREMMTQYGATADRILEFACGTGEFTQMAATATGAKEIVALDISAQGLERTRQRVDHDNLRLVQGDFWADHDLGQAPLVVCIDAIHHLGDVRAVIERLKSFVSPGGIFIGNLWTVDHFHEFQRQRYGNLAHTARCALFLASALLLRVSRGRFHLASYRTQLLRSEDIPGILAATFSESLEIRQDRYFTAFACRP